MHKYSIVIYWSDEDKVFIAEVPDLPGCITHGDTQAAALANANEAIQLWIDTATEFGNPIPTPRNIHMTTNILDTVKRSM
jgi:predicted RNase H-like HicB family nuclease